MEMALKALAPADAPCNNSPETDDSQDSGQLKSRSALGLDEDSAEEVLARADTREMVFRNTPVAGPLHR